MIWGFERKGGGREGGERGERERERGKGLVLSCRGVGGCAKGSQQNGNYKKMK